MVPHPALLESVAAARHDLGKYVAMNLRWLPPEASTEDLRGALLVDLGATRRQGEITEDAAAVWSRVRRPLVGEADLEPGLRVDLSTDPDVQAIDDAIHRIRQILPDLPTADPAHLAEARDAAFRVADALTSLQRRFRPIR